MPEDKLKKIVLSAPETPGIYIFKDRKNNPIYIGKAKNIKKRLLSYFSKSEAKNEIILLNSKNIEFISLKTEEEALILEADLVKFHRPKYNVQLKDDKHFPYVRIDLNEDWPYPEIVRKIKKDRALYFGPYVKPVSIRKTLVLSRKIYTFRNCKGNLPKKACLDSFIGLCSAPCEDANQKDQYRKNIINLVRFLSGDINKLVDETENEMKKYSKYEEFERAAELRDRIKNLKESLIGKREVFNDGKDRDIIGFATFKKRACIYLMQIREGRLQNSFPVFLSLGKSSADTYDDEIIERFIVDYYRGHSPPEEVLLKEKPDNFKILENWIKDKYKYRVRIKKTTEKIAKEIIEGLIKSATTKLLIDKNNIHSVIKELAVTLKLEKLPKLIYAFDVSHIQFQQIKGSQIVFKNAKTYKKYYRQYNIKDGSDDLAAMSEMMTRCSADMKDDKIPKPDLILVDGGIEQLKVVKKSVDHYRLHIPMFSLAKRYENIYTVKGDIISLPKYSQVLLFLKRIRDEAHRFAITQHRKKRRKETKDSLFKKIPGVGEKRAVHLRKVFGTVAYLKEASIEEIAQIPGFGLKRAKAIKEFLDGEITPQATQ